MAERPRARLGPAYKINMSIDTEIKHKKKTPIESDLFMVENRPSPKLYRFLLALKGGRGNQQQKFFFKFLFGGGEYAKNVY